MDDHSFPKDYQSLMNFGFSVDILGSSKLDYRYFFFFKNFEFNVDILSLSLTNFLPLVHLCYCTVIDSVIFKVEKLLLLKVKAGNADAICCS